MKITTLEQALGKRVKCTDGKVRKLLYIGESELMFERITPQPEADWIWSVNHLFLGGTIEEGEPFTDEQRWEDRLSQ